MAGINDLFVQTKDYAVFLWPVTCMLSKQSGLFFRACFPPPWFQAHEPFALFINKQ